MNGVWEISKEERKRQKKLKKEKIEKKKEKTESKKDKKKRKQEPSSTSEPEFSSKNKKQKLDKIPSTTVEAPSNGLPDIRYIVAPMVGASELAFRLLCRKYGATLAYTPMMDAARFARDEDYRASEFQTTPEDRPLVCHFSANTPEDFVAAAKECEGYCDAVDLNLGCPQRTAYVGHFGSYLLAQEDRELIVSMVRAASAAVKIPICVKIRLLTKVEETIALVTQLRDAGAKWIAIHARYRATWDRKGPSARDGPALLDQVKLIRERVPGVAIVTNGNVITYDDVSANATLTKADGVMSAEGILDNPALFLPRYGDDMDATIDVANPATISSGDGPADNDSKKIRKLQKRLREITKIESRVAKGMELDDEQKRKLGKKAKLEVELESFDQLSQSQNGTSHEATTTAIKLGQLHKFVEDKANLADEYLAIVRQHPIKIRTVVFHIRRILRDELTQYQLMEDCIAAQTVDEVQAVVDKMKRYQKDADSFTFDREKAKRQKEALEKKKHEEGKRKRFEERMIRKAKREGKDDMEFYLRMGAQVPTKKIIKRLVTLTKEEQLAEWKKNHSQHCMAYHLGKCTRDRTCAFLHVDSKGSNVFVESEEVAG